MNYEQDINPLFQRPSGSLDALRRSEESPHRRKTPMTDDLLPGIPPEWTLDDTENYLTAFPLPSDFVWPHRERMLDGSENIQSVLPRYRLTKGYGFWLRTTPYFPGLFEAVHAELLATGDELPTAEQMAEKLQTRRRASAQIT
jgi:hypothetical protein